MHTSPGTCQLSRNACFSHAPVAVASCTGDQTFHSTRNVEILVAAGHPAEGGTLVCRSHQRLLAVGQAQSQLMETLPSWEVFPCLRRDSIPATALQAGLQALKLYVGMCVHDVACWILPAFAPVMDSLVRE